MSVYRIWPCSFFCINLQDWKKKVLRVVLSAVLNAVYCSKSIQMFFPDEGILHLSKNNSWCSRVFPDGLAFFFSFFYFVFLAFLSLLFQARHFKDNSSNNQSTVNIRSFVKPPTHKSFCLLCSCFFFFLFIYLFQRLLFYLFILNYYALDVSSEKMCLGEDAHKYSEYISKNSWEGLEKRNPRSGTAGYFCELLFTSC